MSSSETPARATSAPNVSSMARRSGISATQGMHHVAQTLRTRSFAAGGKTALIRAGCFTSRRSAASAGRAAARQRKTARRRVTWVRITRMHVAAFIGASRSGKTTLIAELIGRYVAAGLRVGAIKHTHHALNEENRGDTALFRAAGAEPVILA